MAAHFPVVFKTWQKITKKALKRIVLKPFLLLVERKTAG